MKTVFIVTALLLAAVPLNADDPLAERKAEILELIAAIPENLRCGTGIPWYSFQRRQHDDLTLDALVDLAKSTQEDRVRDLAITSLAYQKNVRLIPYWSGFLDNFDNVRVQWYKRVQAVEALLRIDAPQSTRLLFRHLSAPDTSDETLALICYGCSSMKSIVPSKLWSQIEVLSSHESGRVRTAAFQALLRDEVAPFSTQDARKKHLRRALAHHDSVVVCIALRSLAYNPLPEFFPIMFGYLNHADIAMRVEADSALRNTLSDEAVNRADNFRIVENALREKRWSYRTAPFLAARYAQILKDDGDEFAEAEHALQAAYRTYASNDAYKNWAPRWGATMLHHLIEVKLKRGDNQGAGEVLNRLVEEHPGHTMLIAPNLPPNLRSQFRLVAHPDANIKSIFEDAPVHLRVAPLTETFDAEELLKFNVSIHNIMDEDIILRCVEKEEGGISVPGYAQIRINTGSWTNLHGSDSFADTVQNVTVSPRESFSFVHTLAPLQTGDHVIDFWFDITCEFESGEKWSHRVLANSVKLTIP